MVDLIDELKDEIRNKDADKSLAMLEKVEMGMRTDIDLLNKFLSPATITELQAMLVEHLSVNQRHMQLRRRVPVAKTRAMLFVKAMIVGVKHCESMVQKGN